MSVDRRARFREYMRRLNPAGDPEQTVVEQLYVHTPLGTSDRIVKRLEIEPQSSHLVIGGIGSGKTTELRVVERELAKDHEALVAFLDVPAQQDIAKLKPGVLLGLVGIKLGPAVVKEVALRASEEETSKVIEAARKLQENALAHYIQPEDINSEDDDEPLIRVPGVLSPPERDRQFEALEVALRDLLSSVSRPVVVLLDGLDRAPISTALQQMVYRDVGALQRAGAGVVMVGPQALHSVGRFEQLKDRFTVPHLHGAVDVSRSGDRNFLAEVLSLRAPDGMLPASSRNAIIRWCGGTMRDLLSLARAAGEEAYATGADAVSIDHVNAAADRFGRNLLLGATQQTVDRLLDVKRVTGPTPKDGFRVEVQFTAATEADVDLLAHRLLVEVPGRTVRYFLHPTIVLLLPGLRKSA
jgi:hypothetical protein